MLMSYKYRRIASYFLVPLMVVYTFGSSLSYGGEVWVNTKASQEEYSSDNSSYGTEYNESSSFKGSTKKTTLGASASSSADPSSSLAANAGSGVDINVNTCTGQLEVNLECLKISGVTDDCSIDLSLSNSGSDNKVYGFPKGWTPNLSYVDTNQIRGKKHLYINGSKKYACATNDPGGSGLVYYPNRGVKFEVLSNGYKFTDFSNGTCQNFDSYGKLTSESDVFGNTISYEYRAGSQSPTDGSTKLTGIIDSYGHKIGVNPGNNLVTLTTPSPDSKVISLDLGSDVKLIRDREGRITTIDYSNSTKTVVTYPTGLQVTYTYGNGPTIPTSKGDTPSTAVVSAIQNYQGETLSVVKYDYNPLGNNRNSFLGAGAGGNGGSCL